MTAIEHRELKGITIKNLIVTVASTASIVASVMTTYFGLKNDIGDVKNSQETESRINNIRIKVLEDQVTILQRQIDEVKECPGASPVTVQDHPASKQLNAMLLSLNSKLFTLKNK